MLKLILKWAVKKPATSTYPFQPRTPMPLSRGKLNFDNANCVYCKLCEKKCPTDALVVDRATKTWGIDRLRCINCGACVEGCPKKSLQLDPMHGGPAVTRDLDLTIVPASEAKLVPEAGQAAPARKPQPEASIAK